MWHAEAASFVLRRYTDEAACCRRAPFTAVAFVKMLGAGDCFIEGALRIDGSSLDVTDWRELGRVLMNDFGVRRIWARRKGKMITYDLDRHLKG